MNDMTQHSRRDLLKWFAGVPFLPLGAIATATLAGCSDNNDATAAVVTPPVPKINLKSATFTNISLPSDIAGLASINTGSKLSVTWDDASKSNYYLGYQPFFITGTSITDNSSKGTTGGKIVAGGYFDIHNNPIIDTTFPSGGRQFFSDCPDGTSLLTVAGADAAKLGVKGNPVFAVVQFEYSDRNWAGKDQDATNNNGTPWADTGSNSWFSNANNMYGKLPSPIGVLTLDQDPKTGKLSLVKYHNVDTSSVNGLWITCGASLSPWGTHLSSEEYEPDAWSQGALGSNVTGSGTYFSDFSKNLYGDANKANPYNYGHLPEVTVNTDGTASIKKHYCMGRISHELVQVMPDNRTALMGDDATNGGLFMFVADKEKDLSAGTLYVAKYTSVLSETTTGNIQWIKLGHATSAEVRGWVDGGIKKEDFLDSKNIDPSDSSYTKIILNKKTLWVKVLDERKAAFLETHRYAAVKGGSMGFTKLEGTTVNAKDKKAYSACQNIQDSMIDGGAGWSASNNITFSAANKDLNKKAGGILEHTLKAGQTDSTGSAISSEWVPTSTKLLLQGELASGDLLGNPANPDKLANPDNLKFSENLRTLFMGEDSTNHMKDCLWAYNVDQPVNWGVNPVRILSTPAGAESTGLHAVDNINGWTYIMSNFQHSGDWESVHAKVLGVPNAGLTLADEQPLKPTGPVAGTAATAAAAVPNSSLHKAIMSNWDNRFGAAVGYLTADLQPSIEKK
jgi:secreted PhoX family phosphatase